MKQVMRSNFLVHVLLLIIGLAWNACQTSDSNGQKEHMTDHLIAETGIELQLEEKQQIVLGDYLGTTILDGSDWLIEDSLEQRGGYVWLTRNIHMKSGSLLLEGNFLDEQAATDSLLQESRINRIRIQDPHFQTENGLRIGSTIAELMDQANPDDIGLTHLPDFGYVDVQIGQSHIHFLILDGFLTEEVDDGLRIEDLPRDGTISMIVVM